jgi:hypothetical protein
MFIHDPARHMLLGPLHLNMLLRITTQNLPLLLPKGRKSPLALTEEFEDSTGQIKTAANVSNAPEPEIP